MPRDGLILVGWLVEIVSSSILKPLKSLLRHLIVAQLDWMRLSYHHRNRSHNHSHTHPHLHPHHLPQHRLFPRHRPIPVSHTPVWLQLMPQLGVIYSDSIRMESSYNQQATLKEMRL